MNENRKNGENGVRNFFYLFFAFYAGNVNVVQIIRAGLKNHKGKMMFEAHEVSKAFISNPAFI